MQHMLFLYTLRPVRNETFSNRFKDVNEVQIITAIFGVIVDPPTHDGLIYG